MTFNQAKKGVKVRIIAADDPRWGKDHGHLSRERRYCGCTGKILNSAKAPTNSRGSVNPDVLLDVGPDGWIMHFPVWALEAVEPKVE